MVAVHTRMVLCLGGAWILDGLQITVASSVSGELTQPSTLGMTSTQVGLIASVYLVGEMVGALVFGNIGFGDAQRGLVVRFADQDRAADGRDDARIRADLGIDAGVGAL